MFLLCKYRWCAQAEPANASRLQHQLPHHCLQPLQTLPKQLAWGLIRRYVSGIARSLSNKKGSAMVEDPTTVDGINSASKTLWIHRVLGHNDRKPYEFIGFSSIRKTYEFIWVLIIIRKSYEFIWFLNIGKPYVFIGFSLAEFIPSTECFFVCFFKWNCGVLYDVIWIL